MRLRYFPVEGREKENEWFEVARKEGWKLIGI